MSQKRKALGRGLAALLPSAQAPGGDNGAGQGAAGALDHTTAPDGSLRMVAIEDVRPFKGQPRKHFDEEALKELAQSIKSQGILQPLIVRKQGQSGYELVAGERRWRAAQKAGLREIPVIVREIADHDVFEMALVENLQRKDLNPIEEAEGYQRLVQEFGYSHEAVASRVGKDRSTVANATRLLRLPANVRNMVRSGQLSMGHARALLGIEDTAEMERLGRMIIARGLSVRQVESHVRKKRESVSQTSEGKAASDRPSPAVRDLTERLQRQLGIRVRVIDGGRGKGHLQLHYHSLDELDALLEKLFPDGAH